MKYTKEITEKYTNNRDRFRSSNYAMLPVLEQVKIKGKDILDFGCGDGTDAKKFLSMGARSVTGIDTSESMIRLAESKNLKNCIFITTDEKALPLNSEQFDLVFSQFVLHYIKDIATQCKEINRVLRKNGDFVAIFQCLTTDKNKLNEEVPINLGSGDHQVKIKILSKSTAELKAALSASKMQLIKMVRVRNTDAKIDPLYKNKHNFKNATYIILARKVG